MEVVILAENYREKSNLVKFNQLYNKYNRIYVVISHCYQSYDKYTFVIVQLNLQNSIIDFSSYKLNPN